MTALATTGIVNLALREIGEYRIEDIDEASTPAEIARDLFDQAKRMALAGHEWRFALKQAELVKIPGSPVARYDYSWTIPADFIRLGSVSDNITMQPELREFMTSGGYIFSSTESVFIEYVYDSPAVGAWPPYFVHYVAAMLASEMASPLKSTTERERLEKLAEIRLATARSLDSLQGPTIIKPESNWLAAMRGMRRH